MQRMAHPDGEIANARAAASIGIPFCLSSWATSTIEQVAQAASNGIHFFQLYVHKGRQSTIDLVKRAEKANYTALLLTVDAPRLGKREADEKNAFKLPDGLTLANFAQEQSKLSTDGSTSGLAAYVQAQIDSTLNWEDVQWLKSITNLPIYIKGILAVEDAIKAAEVGVKGIIVSNHGGRQLDHAPATISVLGQIKKAVGDRIEILLDGGVRRGTDIIKALALGAKAVLIGRPALWALACGGQSSIFQMLTLLRNELHLAMMLSGQTDVNNIPLSILSFSPLFFNCSFNSFASFPSQTTFSAKL
eukprot:TRINITY_DN2096_c0_g1_i2.p1 TRINITY_DN2096_c0_g1~~TRINITY_DN2096_c0_g1_i2.p1  ORF type:complete len:304 (+),score=118.23 TRINITY_DN2096_c0_g1_i2:492-1403(+)